MITYPFHMAAIHCWTKAVVIEGEREQSAILFSKYRLLNGESMSHSLCSFPFISHLLHNIPLLHILAQDISGCYIPLYYTLRVDHVYALVPWEWGQ
jgi:hypothetical protein